MAIVDSHGQGCKNNQPAGTLQASVGGARDSAGQRVRLSDVGFAKICKKYNIPRPPRGVAPGIVVGRLQHDMLLPNSHGNGLKVFFRWSD